MCEYRERERNHFLADWADTQIDRFLFLDNKMTENVTDN